MKKTLSIARAKARFAEVVRRAEAGETIVLTRHGRPVARLTPPPGRERAGLTRELSGEVGERGEAYETRLSARSVPGTPRSPSSRRGALERFLRDGIWPRVPGGLLGTGVSKREREEILGYGENGIDR